MQDLQEQNLLLHRILTLNPLKITNGSTTVTVFEENHGRSTSDVQLDLEMVKVDLWRIAYADIKNLRIYNY